MLEGKKIGIMTMHRGNSYGSNLQAFALQQHLMQTYNCETEFIDYYPQTVEKHLYPERFAGGWKDKIKRVVQGKKHSLRICKQDKFDAFAATRYHRSRRYSEIEDLYQDPPRYDIFLTGSDQVFRANKPGNGYLVNYLDFCPQASFKMAYAGSFGTEIIPPDRRERVENLLLALKHISCREREGCELIESIIHKPVPFVLDPVNLLSAEEWRSYAKPVNGLQPGYILVYSLLSAENMDHLVHQVERLTGKKVVVVDTSYPSRYRRGKILYDMGPDEFIWLVDNASYIVTNSFHGTSFSVVFRKNFFSYRIKSPGFLTRSRSLLESIGLQDRIYDNAQDISADELAVDYTVARVLHEERISMSKQYLKAALSSYQSELGNG